MSDRLGKMGEYPFGKLRADDEGAIRIAVGTQRGNVILDFGTSVVWLGMPPEQAEQLADTLRRKAQEARASRS
jgi:hypothetical protein